MLGLILSYVPGSDIINREAGKLLGGGTRNPPTLFAMHSLRKNLLAAAL